MELKANHPLLSYRRCDEAPCAGDGRVDTEEASSRNLGKSAVQFVQKNPIATTVVGLPLLVAGTGVAATAAGFAASGIVAGSIAAGIQSGIGNVAAGSLFASLQSLGALGTFSAMTTGGLVTSAVSATVVAAAAGAGKKKEDESDDDEDHDECSSTKEEEICDDEMSDVTCKVQSQQSELID